MSRLTPSRTTMRWTAMPDAVPVSVWAGTCQPRARSRSARFWPTS
ncbi:MAG TPA: hypothetical protein VGI21_06465 [Streptosporangiaceae bacterium]